MASLCGFFVQRFARPALCFYHGKTVLMNNRRFSQGESDLYFLCRLGAECPGLLLASQVVGMGAGSGWEKKHYFKKMLGCRITQLTTMVCIDL
ncbi:unnamed protein product [Arctogadus glacialis]